MLNDKQVRAAKPKDKLYRLWDGNGLYLEVSPQKAPAWVYKFHFHSRERRMHLGPLADLTLKQARIKRDEARQLARAGTDPIDAKLARKRATVEASIITVQTTGEAWIAWAAQQKGWSPGYVEDVRGQLREYVYRPLGETPLRDITPALLVNQVFKPLVDRGKLETARRLRQKLEQVWNQAQLEGHVTVNAAMPLKGRISAPSVTHFASANEQELPRLLLAVRGYGNRLVEHCLLLQLLTAVRPGEARKAVWSEFNEDDTLWSIPAERTKRRRDHLVPLSTHARQVLSSLRAITGSSPVLFPSRSRWDVPMSENALLMVFGRTGFNHVTAHGMRSLFSTSCHEHGHEADIIEACLSHIVVGVRGVYNRAMYLPQRRELLQWWGDRVEALCRQHAETTNTTPIFPVT